MLTIRVASVEVGQAAGAVQPARQVERFDERARTARPPVTSLAEETSMVVLEVSRSHEDWLHFRGAGSRLLRHGPLRWTCGACVFDGATRAVCSRADALVTRRQSAMLESLREIVRYRSLLRDLVARDLKVRYKRSVLCVGWTMLNPLLMMVIFTVVFGGILRVDTLATGVVEAAKKTNIKLPVVLRLEGTNVDEGKKILMESGFNFVVSDTMKDAADKVVAAARGV